MTTQEQIQDEKRGCCCSDKKHKAQIHPEKDIESCCCSSNASKKEAEDNRRYCSGSK